MDKNQVSSPLCFLATSALLERFALDGRTLRTLFSKKFQSESYFFCPWYKSTGSLLYSAGTGLDNQIIRYLPMWDELKVYTMQI